MELCQPTYIYILMHEKSTQSTVTYCTIPAYVNTHILTAKQEKQTLISHRISLVCLFPGYVFEENRFITEMSREPVRHGG